MQMQLHLQLQLKFMFLFPLAFHIFHLSSSAVLAPIAQDYSTRLFTLSLYFKTPSQPTSLLLDLGASFNWVQCSHNYGNSPTYRTVPCASSLCAALGSHNCSNDTCVLFLSTSKDRRKTTAAVALTDTLAMPVTDGYNPGHLQVIPDFVFSCSKKFMVKAHRSKGISGLAGLGWSNFSLVAQISTALSLPRLFALCLSGSPSAPGVAFFGNSGPYNFLPQVDLSKQLNYTPLLFNATVGNRLKSSEDYSIGLTAIKVNDKVLVPLNRDVGGARLSTVTPYTTFHTSIYKPFVDAFVNESAALDLTVTQPVEPFRICYDASDISETRLGPAVPVIDFVMESDDVVWRIYGSNAMVRMSSSAGVGVWCLAFVDGGPRYSSSMVIGGHQMVDNLLQFDLESKQLGFSSSVLVHNTMCANFNFTQSTA